MSNANKILTPDELALESTTKFSPLDFLISAYARLHAAFVDEQEHCGKNFAEKMMYKQRIAELEGKIAILEGVKK